MCFSITLPSVFTYIRTPHALYFNMMNDLLKVTFREIDL